MKGKDPATIRELFFYIEGRFDSLEERLNLLEIELNDKKVGIWTIGLVATVISIIVTLLIEVVK